MKFVKINREKFDLLLIFFNILLCTPFSVFDDFANIYIKLLILVSSSVYLISRSVISRKKVFKTLIITTSLIILYSLIYIGFGMGYVHSLIIQVVYLLVMLSIYLYFTTATRLKMGKRFLAGLIIYVSILTIISFLGSTFHFIPFPMKKIGGYFVGYNYLFGGVSMKAFYRPQWYFAEPSYLGFFLGFAFLFLKKQDKVKYKTLKLILVFVAGMLVFSMTFYFSMLIGLFSEFVIVRLMPFIKPVRLSLIYLILFVAVSSVYITQLDKVGDIFFSDFSTSFNNRKERMELSIAILKKMNFTELLTGKGTGYISIDKNRIFGASNSYMRTLVENGVIVLLIYLLLIYSFLKQSPSLLIYTLVGLSSVVILETPFFMLIVVLARRNTIELQ